MSRALTAPVSTALDADNVPALILVDLDFPAGALRCCNAGYTFTWGGYEWLGLGNLGQIDLIEEGAELQMYGVSMTLSGIPTDNIQRALGQHYQGRDCKVWLAPLSADYTILADPILAFSGRMDTMDISLGDTASIRMTGESRLTDWERPRIRRFNDEDQKSEYLTDRGFEFVAAMVEKNLVWGRA